MTIVDRHKIIFLKTTQPLDHVSIPILCSLFFNTINSFFVNNFVCLYFFSDFWTQIIHIN